MENEEKLTRAKKARIIVKKVNGLIKDQKNLAKFKEPVMFLIKRNNRVEFYEDASKGRFEVKDDEGRSTWINLDPSSQLTFDYGKDVFRGYICYEDDAFPYPQNPLLQSSMLNTIMNKILHDKDEYKSQKLSSLAKLGKPIAIIIAVIIGGVILYTMLAPDSPAPAKETALETGKEAVKSATVLGSIMVVDTKKRLRKWLKKRFKSK